MVLLASAKRTVNTSEPPVERVEPSARPPRPEALRRVEPPTLNRPIPVQRCPGA